MERSGARITYRTTENILLLTENLWAIGPHALKNREVTYKNMTGCPTTALLFCKNLQ
jgi:hypothetical protein